jgi:hypothetical protein
MEDLRFTIVKKFDRYIEIINFVEQLELEVLENGSVETDYADRRTRNNSY